MESPAAKGGGFGCGSVIVLSFSIAFIALGVNASDACPAEPMIPTFMIANGSVGIAILCLQVLPAVIGHFMDLSEEGKNLLGKIVNVIHTFCSIAQLVVLIMGSVYVYAANPTFDNPTAATYCEYGPYKFAYVMLTIYWVLSALIVATVCFCCPCVTALLCCAAAATDHDGQDAVPTKESDAKDKPTGIQ